MKPTTITRKVQMALRVLAEARSTASYNALTMSSAEESDAFAALVVELLEVDRRLRGLLYANRRLLA